ncbi:MAG: lipoprotein NlpI [Chthonomonadaceae bacterium]|nr:lipoprotein NlpI [Chthonomonadaceae bacterium]
MELMTSEECHDVAEAYYEARQWPQACEAYEAGLKLDAGKPSAGYWLYSMGYCYKQMKQLKEAEDCFKRGIAANPAYSLNYEELTRLYSFQLRYAEAVEMAEEANRLNPDSPDVLRPLAIAYDGVGRNEEACAIGKQVIHLEPDKSSNYVNLGISLAILDRNTPALENFQKAVSIDPSYARARYNLGGHYLSFLEVGFRAFRA